MIHYDTSWDTFLYILQCKIQTMSGDCNCDQGFDYFIVIFFVIIIFLFFPLIAIFPILIIIFAIFIVDKVMRSNIDDQAKINILIAILFFAIIVTIIIIVIYYSKERHVQ